MCINFLLRFQFSSGFGQIFQHPADSGIQRFQFFFSQPAAHLFFRFAKAAADLCCRLPSLLCQKDLALPTRLWIDTPLQKPFFRQPVQRARERRHIEVTVLCNFPLTAAVPVDADVLLDAEPVVDT